MKISEIKEALHDTIDHANEAQLNELFGLVRNYFNATSSDDWERLSEQQKSTILRGVSEAEKGLVSPLSDINKRLRKKYGLNG